jgi:uncharacterized protein YggE
MSHTSSVVRTVVVVILGMLVAGPSPVTAQGTSGVHSGISVIGHGEAHAPADTATLHITVGEGNYAGPALPQPGVLPGERERESVAPIVEAIVGTGVDEDQIEVLVGPSIAELWTYFGPATAIVRVTVDNPGREQLGELVDTAALAAADERLVVGRVSATYAVEDCAPLEREAREMAVSDALSKADVMAELIGVTRDDVVGTRDVPSESQAAFGPYGFVASPSACGLEDVSLSAAAAYAQPPFDPAAEPLVTAYAAVEVSFAIVDAANATPAP